MQWEASIVVDAGKVRSKHTGNGTFRLIQLAQLVSRHPEDIGRDQDRVFTLKLSFHMIYVLSAVYLDRSIRSS